MTWTKFDIKTVYNDGYSTPIENAFVFVKFVNSNNQWSGNYFSGYTDQNGIITINSNTATTNSTNILYRAIDEDKWLQEGDFSETIVDNTQYLIEFDIDGNGIEWDYSIDLYDALYGAITHYGEKYINPKKIEIYTKNRDETYSLERTYTSSTVTINGIYKTIEFLIKIYRYDNDNDSIFWMRNVNYKEALWDTGGAVFVCDNYYDINIPKINDTINWNDSSKTLNKSNILITLTSSTFSQTVVSAETFSNSVYIRMYLSKTIFHVGGIYPFENVVNPEFNAIKVYKNHYNEYENGCVISADTNGNYMFIVSGLSENNPIILEREPNVCMINEDLFDYVVSLTGIRPNMSNFHDYETDADLMKKVGVSKLSFYNDWISAITQYLPPQYQGQTASTLDDFKSLFVSEISTDYVQTNYALSLGVENQYLENSNHGFVWDRCFVPSKRHEYVDLGLPSGTLWATENIKDKDGNELYFAWGETSGYTAEQVGYGEVERAFTWNDYEFGPDTALTKYNGIDGLTVLEHGDDAATFNWDSNWRMPTKADFNELITNTTTAFTEVNGVNGLLCTSTANTGNTLFFPAVGTAEDGGVYGVGANCIYWSASLNDDGVYVSWALYFRGGGCEVGSDGRCYGHSVRPVRV